ncbi:MAG TPA: lysozyme inhibitor LprI family protein [Telluria sp.]
MPATALAVRRRARSGKFILLAGVLAGAMLASTPGAAARRDPKPAEWHRQCLRVAALKPPVQDLAREPGAGRCDATELYYDTRSQPASSQHDWQKVRQCAHQNKDAAVLMMLYANGDGVMPNLSLAAKYACSIDSPPAEMRARLAHLGRKAGGAGGDIDLCDDVAGGERLGMCATLRERQRDQQRAVQIAGATRHWSEKEQLGFDIASKALRYFAQSRYEHETDLSGDNKRTLQVDAMAAELDQFVNDLADFESGKLPRFSEAEYQSLDDKLQQTYRQFMAGHPTSASYLGTIRKTGVEKTQRAWLAYRDAMELLGAMKYPSAPASGWKALVTSRRIRQLAELDDAAAGR